MTIAKTDLRVGCVEYINALPFYLPFRLREVKSDVEFIYEIPSQLNNQLRTKQLDAALTSSAEYLDGNYQMLPGFGIAGRDRILSVNLYAKQPVQTLSGACIGLTHHSATSIALLKILCDQLWQIEPKFEPLDRKLPYTHYDAFLLIGDEALQNLTIPGFCTIDLNTAWYELTGLPFVFAVFAARTEIEHEKIHVFQKQLDQALQWSRANQSVIEQEALKRCFLPPELVSRYYAGINYRLSEQEMLGLETFKRLCHVSTIGS